MSLTPEEQLDVLAVIWNRPKDFDGWVFLPFIPGTANSKLERRQNWNESTAFHWPNDRDKILEHLHNHQQDDLYFTPNVFLGDMRSELLTGEETVLYADLDEADPGLLDEDLKPSIAWESSPGRYQAVWLLRKPEIGTSERGGLNHRLTLYVGADISGWDTTQLLRVPGRPNYKFNYKNGNGEPAPGRLLWCEEGRKYSVSILDEKLPEIPHVEVVEQVEEEELDQIDIRAVWTRVRLKVPKQIREYMAMRDHDIDPDAHDRSGVIWQICKELARAGCTIAEIVAVVRHTPWNKYEGRPKEIEILRNGAVKAKGELLQEEGEAAPLEEATVEGDFADTPLWVSDLSEQAEARKRPSWLVRNIWQKGSVGFIAGEPKSYKSYFALDMALSVATGTPFLNDPQFSTGGERKVLYLQEEDSLPLVMHRALQIIEQKAPNRSWAGQIVDDEGSPWVPPENVSRDSLDANLAMPETPLTLAMHVRKQFVASNQVWQAWLSEFIDEYGFELVVIDTLGTTLGDVELNDSVKMNERVLKPLKYIAESTGCAMAIVHHNRKPNDSGKTRSGQKMVGTQALHAWVESALYVTKAEIITGQPTQVFVERENKLAEDLKFRVKIPTMWQEKGHEEDKGRQLWEPEVLTGWGDADANKKEQGDRKEEEKRDKKGLKVAERMAALVDELARAEFTVDDIVMATGQSNRRNQYETEIRHAVRNGYVAENTNGTYTPLV